MTLPTVAFKYLVSSGKLRKYQYDWPKITPDILPQNWPICLQHIERQNWRCMYKRQKNIPINRAPKESLMVVLDIVTETVVARGGEGIGVKWD